MNAKIIAAGLGLATLAAAAAPAMADDWGYRGRDRVAYRPTEVRVVEVRASDLDARVSWQFDRIDRGERRGFLGVREARRLRDREREIADRLHDAERHGADRHVFFEIQRDLDRQNDQIARDARDHNLDRW